MALKAGQAAEALAQRWLEAQGLKLISRNQHARGGELDLVMRDGDTVAVIEVRQRRSSRFGSAAESVDARKRARIVKATRGLIARQPELARHPIRFDVVAIDGVGRIDWLRNAFDAGDWA
ncbi:MAG: YraN family protein [Pseudomonadota bacterium]|nr:YraN family protein [Pseudomonadota bacterium]